MSDVMLHGVLNMPTNLWSSDVLDQKQRYDRYTEASRRILELELKLEQALDMLEQVLDMAGARLQ